MAESVTFSIREGDTVFAPPYVESVTATSVARVERQTDLCGQTEVERVGDAPYQLEVTGEMLEADKEVLKQLRLLGQNVYITNDIHTGPYIIEDVEITQNDEQVTAEYAERPVTPATERAAADLDGDDGVFEGKVYEFRIMTEDPSDEGD